MTNPVYTPPHSGSKLRYAFRRDLIWRFIATPATAIQVFPSFARAAAMELSDNVRGLVFRSASQDGTVSVHLQSRPVAEIEDLVVWAARLWNDQLRPIYASRVLTVEELVSDATLRTRESSRESLVSFFEGWHESGDDHEGHYVDPQLCGWHKVGDPQATAGNLAAAFGLAVLEKSVTDHEGGRTESAFDSLASAWNFASIARWLNHMEMGSHFESAGHSAKMSRAAIARHKNDPKQAVKLEVRDCWAAWNETPDQYKSIAAFSRAMVDKWPDTLTSAVVIERWVRGWSRLEK